jgi:hypothetical protein
MAIRFVGIEPDLVTAIKMAEKAASKIQRFCEQPAGSEAVSLNS